MKRSVVALLLCCLIGCSGRAIQIDKHGDFQVELLFEKDGYKIYRFYDAGHLRYYVTPEGSVTYSEGRKIKQNYEIQTVR